MILGIRHAALPAFDLQRAVHFYIRTLGFTPYHQSDRDWAMVSWAGTTISLVQVRNAQARDSHSVSQSVSGAHPAHLGIVVETPEEVDQRYQLWLRQTPRIPGLSPPVKHRDDSYGFYFHDTEHNKLEYIFIPQATMEQRQRQSTALILVAHGSSDPQWQRTMEQLAKRMHRNAPGLQLRMAYMEFSRPSLQDAVDSLFSNNNLENRSSQITEVCIVPVFLSSGGHVTRDLPQQVAEAARRYPGIRFHTTAALGDSPIVQEALVSAALNALGAAS